MSDDLRTDDDIARLFADANPIPVGRSADRSTAPRRTSVMVDLADQRGPDEPTRPTRPWAAIAAAVTIGVLAAGLTFVVLDDGSSAPADEGGRPTTITTPDTLAPPAGAVTSGPVIDLVDAFNTRDAEGMRRALGDTASSPTRTGVEEIIGEFAWYDAFDWRWTDLSCVTSTTDTVRCDVTVRNRLTDYSGVTRSAQLLGSLDGDRITVLAITEDFDEYSQVAFEPFREYVFATNPDDFVRMWDEDGSLDPDARAELFDSYLDRYTVDDQPPTPAHRVFLGAHASGTADRTSLTDAFAPGAEIDGAWADEPDGYVDGVETLAALGFDWGTPEYCRIPEPATTFLLSCFVRPASDLDAAGLLLGGQTLSFVMSADGIETFGAGSIAASIDERLSPFLDWIVERHPQDADVLLVISDDERALSFAPEGADRLAELVDEYLTGFDHD